jgi:ABC-type multidrug transport system permease subunit
MRTYVSVIDAYKLNLLRSVKVDLRGGMLYHLIAEISLADSYSYYIFGRLVGTLLLIYVVYWVLNKVTAKIYGKELSLIQRAVIACVATFIIVGSQVLPYLIPD